MQVHQKLDSSTYGRLRVTSDTHFGHNQEFLYKKRGYDDVVQMNNDMINIINNHVSADDILLHLGDFCLNTTTEEYYNIISRLHVKEMWLLWGNHNNPIQRSYGNTRTQVAAHAHGTLIRYLDHYFTFRNGKKTFVCFHFPISVWDGQSHNSMHLCGHSHGSFQPSRPEDATRKILDCGWDVHNKPLTMQEIEHIMSTKNTNTLHHDQ